MRNKKIKILFCCMVFVGAASTVQAQASKKTTVLQSFHPSFLQRQSFSFTSYAGVASKAGPLLAPDFYAKQLGFFCRQEIKMDKITKIPFRFRLGSVAQCDWLEGKKRQ